MPDRFVPAPNVAQVNMMYQFGNDIMENVYDVLGTGAWTAATLLSLGSQMRDWENTIAKNQRSVQIALTRITVTDQTTAGATGVDMPVAPAINGTVPGVMAPGNVTWCIKKTTGLRGRSFRGRTYWIGMPTTFYTSALMDPTKAGLIVAALNAIGTSISTVNGGQLVIVSRRTGGAVRPGNAVVTPVVNFASTDLILDSQRRRLPGRGI